MKRLFVILSAVLVTFVAIAQEQYSPLRVWKGENVLFQYNVAQLDSITYNIVKPAFNINVSEITSSSTAVTVTVTPADTSALYYIDVISQDEYDSYESEDSLVASCVSRLTLLTSYFNTIDNKSQTIYDFLFKGTAQRHFANLSASTSYYAISFQLDSATQTLVGSITKTPFQTPVKRHVELSFTTQLIDTLLWFNPNSENTKYLAVVADVDSLYGFSIPDYFEAYWSYYEDRYLSFPPVMRNILTTEGAGNTSGIKENHEYVFVARAYSDGFYCSDLFIMHFTVSDTIVTFNSTIVQTNNLSNNQQRTEETESNENSILLWNNGLSLEFQLKDVDSLTFRSSGASPSQTYPDNLQFTSCYIGIADTSMYGETMDTLRAANGQLYNVKLVQAMVLLFSEGFYLSSDGEFAGAPEGSVIWGNAPVHWAPSWANGTYGYSSIFITGNWYINDAPSRPDRTIPTGKINNNYLTCMHSYVNCLNIHDTNAAKSSLQNANQHGCEGALLYYYVYHTRAEGYPEDGYYADEMPELFVDGVMFEVTPGQSHSDLMHNLSGSLIRARALKNEVVDSANVYRYGCSLHYDSINGYTWNDEDVHWDARLHMFYYDCCPGEGVLTAPDRLNTNEQYKAISNVGDIQTTNRILSALSKSSGKREHKARSSSAVVDTSLLDSLQLIVALRSGNSITYAMNALQKITFTDDTTMHLIDIHGAEQGTFTIRDINRIVLERIERQDTTSVLTPPVCADTWHAIVYKWYLIPYPSEYIDVQYNLTTDTIIGDYTYRKLIRDNTTCVGGLRQTDDGMKVYYYDMASPAEWPFSHVDCLLYDFSADVGDTIKNAYFRTEDVHSDYCYGAEFVSWVVLDKDTIDGRIHMMVARYDSLGYYDPAFITEWIQGVGTRHVLWPDDYGLQDMGGFNTLYALCAMHGDETLYSYNLESLGIENNCTEWHFTALDDIQADDSSIRKFLRNGQLLIQTPLGTFNATGQQIDK